MNYKPLMEGSEEIGKSEKNIKVEEKRVEKKNLEKMRRTL